MILIKINIRIIILTFLIAILMYPKTLDFLIRSAQNIYIAQRLSTTTIQGNKTTLDTNKNRIVFIFDDGWRSVFSEAYPILKKYDYTASVPIIPSRIDEKEYMSYKELSQLYLQGWDLLNHSYSHEENIYDKSEELFLDFNRARQWMKNRYLGDYGDMLVMPYGEINPYLIKKFKDSGYRNVRTSDNILILDRNNIEYYPVTTINLLTEVPVK